MDHCRELSEYHEEDYVTCCGKVHCKNASYLIAIGCCAVCVFGFFLDHYEHFENEFLFVYSCLFSAVTVLMIIGLKAERQRFLIPYILFAITSVFICSIGIFFAIWTLTSEKSLPSRYLLSAIHERDSLHQYLGDINLLSTQRKVSRCVGLGTLVVSTVAIPLFLYSARVLQQCHQFLKAYRAAFSYSQMNRAAHA